MAVSERERELGLVEGTPDEEGYAQVPGGHVWWRRVGAGPKTPLVLLHGGPGAGHNYLLPFLAILAAGSVVRAASARPRHGYSRRRVPRLWSPT